MEKDAGGFCGGGDSLCVMGEKESRGLSPVGSTAVELLLVGRSAARCCRKGERRNLPVVGCREEKKTQPSCCWLL